MASIVDTSVKHFYSAMAGAPALSGTAGSLIATLDACLVSGFGAKAVDSGSITGGVCRLSFASGVSAAKQEAVILVSGASPAALNGEQKVTAVANGWVEFKTALPDGVVTGSVSFKLAPLGWEKVFTGTNKAVYRPTDPASTRPYIRVDDSDPLYARVQMYEFMTDVDTGAGVAPPMAGGNYWHKRAVAGGSGIYWLLIGDSRGFYYVPAPYMSTTPTTAAEWGAVAQFAGDINSYRSGDAWCGLLTGADNSGYSAVAGCVFQSGNSTGRTLMRASHGLGSGLACEKLVLGSAGGTSGRSGLLGSFPSRADNGLQLTPILIMDGPVAAGPRGEMPGALFCPQDGLGSAWPWDVRLTKGSAFFTGKTLLSTNIADPGSNGATSVGRGFFDVTGPWRS